MSGHHAVPVASTTTRILTSLFLLLILLLGSARPAFADPPGPTNFRTEVTGVEPGVEGIEVEVLGGDSYLQLTAIDVDVLLRGYVGLELYLRWLDTGEVQVNTNAVAYAQNQSRYGLQGETIPSTSGADAPPNWETVATNGTYAWHDHRIHWMSPSTLPPNVDPSRQEPQLAYEWPEPIVLEVDGRTVEVEGRLTWLPDTTPAVPVVAAVLLLAAVVIAGRRRPMATIGLALSLGAASAVVIGLAENVGLAPGVQSQPLSLVLPVVALAVTAAALVTRDRGDTALAMAGLAGVPLLVWVVSHLGALVKPIVPYGPGGLVRTFVAVALGLGLGAVVVAGRTVLSSPGPEPPLAGRSERGGTVLSDTDWA